MNCMSILVLTRAWHAWSMEAWGNWASARAPCQINLEVTILLSIYVLTFIWRQNDGNRSDMGDSYIPRAIENIFTQVFRYLCTPIRYAGLSRSGYPGIKHDTPAACSLTTAAAACRVQWQKEINSQGLRSMRLL